MIRKSCLKKEDSNLKIYWLANSSLIKEQNILIRIVWMNNRAQQNLNIKQNDGLNRIPTPQELYLEIFSYKELKPLKGRYRYDKNFYHIHIKQYYRGCTQPKMTAYPHFSHSQGQLSNQNGLQAYTLEQLILDGYMASMVNQLKSQKMRLQRLSLPNQKSISMLNNRTNPNLCQPNSRQIYTMY